MVEHELEGSVVPEVSASQIPFYPQFKETAIPVGSGAIRASRGYIRPFSNDAAACNVLRGIVAGRPLHVSEGRLDFDGSDLPEHPIEGYLREMAMPCNVVVLEFPGSQHPRAYLIDPPVIHRFSVCQHMWPHLAVVIDGRRTPALCIYSGNLFQYQDDCDRLPQFMNQLSTYLAKYLIFLKTRMLHTLRKDGKLKLQRKRLPSEPINFGTLNISKKFMWFGIWVGPVAPQGPLNHLQTVDPNGECWCTSGKLYKQCCRPKDQRYMQFEAAGRCQ